MKKVVLITVIFGLALGVSAEINPKKAALLSTLIPGAGEIYTQSYKRAGFFIGTELLLLFSYFKLNNEIDIYASNYKQMAKVYANANATNYNDEFYQNLHSYESVEAYNEEVIQAARNYYLIYQNDSQSYSEYIETYTLDTEETYWHWDSQSKWDKYKITRSDHNEFEIWAKMTLGFMMVNRLVSVLDATFTARKSRIEKEPQSFYFEPDLERKAFMVGYKYDF